MNEAQLQKLLKKTQAAAANKPKKNRTYDPTLDATVGDRLNYRTTPDMQHGRRFGGVIFSLR